jgi:hypothetical protein
VGQPDPSMNDYNSGLYAGVELDMGGGGSKEAGVGEGTDGGGGGGGVCGGGCGSGCRDIFAMSLNSFFSKKDWS